MEEYKDHGVVYSKELQSAIERIGLLSAESGTHSYFSLYNDITPALFNHSLNYDISLSTYKLVWQMLNRIVVAGNFVWFKQYWSWAVQYEMFKFQDNKRTEPYKRFYFFHIMTGALLCFNRRYDWLSYTLFFTTQLPERFGLVPNTYQEIADVATSIYLREEQPFYFESHFSIAGIADGVRNDSIIAGAAYEYLALLIIRLWSLDFNVSFSEPKTLPLLDPVDIEKNNTLRVVVVMLKGKVQAWYAKNRLDEIELHDIPLKSDVIQLLDEFIDSIETKNKEIFDRAEPDPDKIEKLKKDLKDAALRHSGYLPTAKDSKLEEKNAIHNDYRLEYKYKIDKAVLIAGSSVSYTNMPDVLMEVLTHQAIFYFEQLFIRTKERHSYRVRYDDIGNAFKKLSLTAEYVILSFGEYLDSRWKIENPIISVSSRMSCIIIIHKKQLPYTEFVTKKIVEPSMDDILSDGVHLYSNVDHMGTDNMLILVQYVRLYSSKESMNYIRLDVDHFVNNDKLDIEKVEPIEVLKTKGLIM